MFALDIDNTLNDLSSSIRAGLRLEDFTADGVILEYDSWRGIVPNSRLPDAQVVIKALLADEWTYASAPALEGAAHAAAYLKRKGLLSGYVTNRPKWLEKSTLEWLATHGFPDAALTMNLELTKAGALKLMGAKILIDDKPLELTACNVATSTVAFHHAYNAHLTDIPRFSSWTGFERFLSQLPMDARLTRNRHLGGFSR